MAYRCSACPIFSPNSARSCWSCGRKPAMWNDFAAATGAFATIYSDVTSRLVSLAADPAVSKADREWFDYLIQGFRNQYTAWQWKTNLREYLASFHRARVPKLYS